ncbi:purine and uridine phosphorylase [Colletotrichum falcatum]|nr:purine and uridine phosphorylase [Colletotrichum falcatum]
MTARARARQRDDFQIAVICALPLEYDAAVFAFDEIWEDGGRPANAPGDSTPYTTGRMGSHNVVLLLLPGMGKANAAGAAARLQSSYTGIKLAILCGICGGVPSPGTRDELLLGDVVISKSVLQYDLGRRYPDRFAPKDTVEESLGRPSREVRTLVTSFETHHGRSRLQDRASQVLEQVQQKAHTRHQDLYKRPDAADDRLFEPDYLHRHRDSSLCGCGEAGACEIASSASCETLECDASRLVPRSRLEAQKARDAGDAAVPQELRVLVGRVGSADTVMKSGLDRDRVAKDHGLVAFEMEGAGVWDEFPCVVVKAVCDYADSHKNKRWQNFAAATAASTTKALLEQYTQTDRPSPQRTWFLVPYIENPDFIERSDVSQQIKRLFGHEQHQDPMNKPRSRVALHGLGGIGKTQIALAYTFWLRHDRPDLSVFWVHASNADRFRQSYSRIAHECNVPGHDDPQTDVLSLVKTWLEGRDCGRWLMVIDNADDTQLFFPPPSENSSNPKGGLGRYIPECAHGYVLVTTRNKQVASKIVRGKAIIEIGEMSEREANQLIHQILDDDCDEASADELATLASQLEHLPLAIAQAAAFMQENSIPVSKYLELLEEGDDGLVDQLSEPFEAVGRDSETPHALTATWIISFNQIQQQEALASDILSFASLLDRQAVPEKLIIDFCNDKSEQGVSAAKVTKALGTLKAFSFISATKDHNIDMHRLVQLVTRKWLENHGRLARYADQALKVLSGAYPTDAYENRYLCRDYLPHANALLQIKASNSKESKVWRAGLLNSIATYLMYVGQWKDAEKSASMSVKLYKGEFGEENSGTLSSMSNLAVTYIKQGRVAEAEELQMKVLEIRKRVFGEEHPSTLNSMGNLASTYANQSRLEEAEELEVKALEIRKRVLGEEHPDTLRGMNNLAYTWRDQGRWDEALTLMEDCAHRAQRRLGTNHPNTTSCMLSLLAWKEESENALQEPHSHPPAEETGS